MRVLTVRQPWAWAIIHSGKDVENRSRNIAGGYRGPVAIHAAARDASPYVPAMHAVADLSGAIVLEAPRGVILGVVDLAGAHHADDCMGLLDSDTGAPLPACSPWAMSDHQHLMLANPLALATPIPAKGRLGLWRPGDELEQQITNALEASA